MPESQTVASQLWLVARRLIYKNLCAENFQCLYVPVFYWLLFHRASVCGPHMHSFGLH